MKRCVWQLCWLVCGAGLLAGQSQSNYYNTLDNGAHILYQIWDGVDSQPGQKSVSQVDCEGNVICRKLYNADGTPWLGFEVHVDRVGDGDFRISFAPTQGFPYFAQGPAPRQIHDGDRVMMDVLEQPGTGKKVFDVFQVFVNEPHHDALPLPFDSIPSVIPTGTTLRISHPGLAIGAMQVWAQETGGVAGPLLFIDVPRVGRFGFSSTARPGFRLEAVAEGNEIRIGGPDHYMVMCDAAVVDRPGSWFLWMKFEPATMPAPESAGGPPPLEVMATLSSAGLGGTKPGLRLSVKNVSTKNVLAYALRLHFTDPETGAGMGSGAHTEFGKGLNGVPRYLLPGEVASSPRAQSLPVTANGAPAKYTLSVDLVVFGDGSTWGPASSAAAVQLWKQVQASGLVKP
jgi:hypothetical protein